MTSSDAIDNSQIFENIWLEAVSRVDTLTNDNTARRVLKALAMGGSVAAESAVSNCQSLKKHWGEGNESAAKAITQLFALIILGQLYYHIGQNAPDDQAGMIPPEINIARLVYIFGGEPDIVMDDYNNFSRQFACDIEKFRNMKHLSILLLAKIGEICGHKCVDWNKIDFPVVELKQLTKSAVVDSRFLSNLLDVTTMQGCVNLGAHAMTSYFTGLN